MNYDVNLTRRHRRLKVDYKKRIKKLDIQEPQFKLAHVEHILTRSIRPSTVSRLNSTLIQWRHRNPVF